MRKRIVSVLLIIVILICALPVGAAAATGGVQTKLNEVMEEYPVGSSWNSSFDGGTQCYGFAKMVIYRIFGKSGNTYRRWAYNGSSSTGMTAIKSITGFSSANVKQLLSNARCGDVLQFDTPKMHTMIVCRVDSDGVWVYDCNWDWKCGVQHRKVSFGKWSSRNSNKLTLLRASNYDSVNQQTVLTIQYNANGGTITGSDKTYDIYKVMTDAGVNMRSGAGTSNAKVITIPTGATFTVTETKTAGGYTWGKTSYDGKSGWCVISEDWTKKTGTQASTDYYLNQNLIYSSETAKAAVQTVPAGVQITAGLQESETFGLARKGYLFIGWSTSASGGTVLNPKDTTLFPTDLTTKINSGSCTVTLYAQWATTHTHTFTNYVYNFDATSSRDGTETARCKQCDATDIRTKAGTKLKDSAALFSDVSASKWYKTYLDYAITHGIMQGTNDLMTPDANMTRAQFVQVLANLAGVDTSNRQVETEFSDVAEGKWYAPAVKWASEAGIVAGVGDGLFDPNANINREQMCTMLVRYLTQYEGIVLKQTEAKVNFSDAAKISSWAKESVDLCQRAGLVSGVTTTTFAPQNLATRAQVATIMVRAHQKYL